MKIEELRKKRSNWDFSNFNWRREIFKSCDDNEIIVDTLQEGNSNCGYVRFVNDEHGLSVYGDFGNWIFCRPFLPSKDGYVSGSYWNEKLQISSCQNQYKYDPEETAKELKENINNTDDWSDDSVKFFKHLLNYVDDEIEYTYMAYRDFNTVDIDPEYIPFCKTGSYQLLIVFDAFNEICSRIND